MANKSLFQSSTSYLPRANSRNEAGGRAYAFGPKHALAQIAATGCFNGVFYASAESQLDELRSYIDQVNDDVYLAKLAVYAREKAFMKDMPAALIAILAARDPQLMHQVFDRVIDNGRVLRTLFQMIRSGQFGKRSLSSSLQRAFQRWLNEAGFSKLLSASIGNDPCLRDVLRLARPTPKDNERRALFGWLTGKEVTQWAPAGWDDLPQVVKDLTAYRAATSEAKQVQLAKGLKVRWDLMADAALGPAVWMEIVREMGPQALRMNLNTMLRQGVFGEDLANSTVGQTIAKVLGSMRSKSAKRSPSSKAKTGKMVDYVAARLESAEEIRRSRQFPYQYFSAYLNASDQVPHKIKAALHKAAEIACGNVPELPGPIVIGVDVSGSMQCSVTGWRGRGASSKVRCVDAAAVFAAAMLRRNPDSVIIPFDHRAHSAQVDPGDSILSLSKRLASYGGGATDCSVPLREANTRYKNRRFSGCVLVSDNESWVGTGRYGSTGVMEQWHEFVKNQLRLGGHEIDGPKLVCIDIQPYGSTQAPERADILNIGGFSDAVFNVVAGFVGNDASRFVSEVEAIEL